MEFLHCRSLYYLLNYISNAFESTPTAAWKLKKNYEAIWFQTNASKDNEIENFLIQAQWYIYIYIYIYLQNTNKEFIRKQVEKCYTDEDVEILLNEQLEKEQLSSNDKQNPSKNLIEASTSTSPSIPSNNSIPLELVNNTYSLVSKALDKHETYK